MAIAMVIVVAAVATFALLQSAGGSARAQTPDSTSAFTVDSYEPGMLPIFDLLGLATSRVPGHLVPTFGVQLGYVDELLELAKDGAPRDIDAVLVRQRIRAEVTFGLGLFDFFALALQLPLVLDQAGDDLALLNRPGEAVSGAAFGDIRFAARARIVHGAGFGIALGVDLYLPTGNSEAFASYGDLRVRPLLIADWHAADGLGLVVNLGWQSVPETLAHNLVVDDGLTWGVGLDLPTPAPELHVLASVFGTAPLSDGRDPSDTDTSHKDDRSEPIEFTGALQLALGDVALELGGGAGLSRGVGAPSWRGFFEVAWSPDNEVVPDSDNDGLSDAVDACPRAAEDRDGHNDEDGCPDLDDDGDGIADIDDGSPDATGFGSCRNIPEDKDSFFDADGCPEPDNDNDGIPDGRDGPIDASGFGACRDKPEDLDGHDDLDGCPDYDNDEDGVPDVADGPVDANGFGVCRDAPETKNDYRDDDGCPDSAPKSVRVTQFKIEILEKVYFQYDKAIIKPESFALLDEVARVLNEAPELTRIQVEGHTDGDGAVDYNQGLSQRRAESVVAYLVEHKVDPKRLVALGFGKSRPLVTGPAAMRERGRALNRRVEFVILDVNGRPHTTTAPVILDRPEIGPHE